MTSLEELDAFITEVEGKILHAEDHIDAAVGNVEELKYWRGKESQLREKKWQLREEKLLLLKSAGAVMPPPCLNGVLLSSL